VVNDGGLWFHIGTRSTNMLVTKNAYQPNSGGNTDHFVGNLDFNGSPNFATYFGGTGHDIYNEFGVVGLAANATSMVFTGYSEKNTGFPLMGTSIDNAFISSPNTVSRINIDGSLAYSIYYGQSEDVQPIRSIAMDENGNTYIATNEHEGFLPTTIGAYRPDSVAVCVGDIYQMGEPFVFRHTYRWAPLNYIDNALIAQPNFKVGFLPDPNPQPYTITKTNTITGCQDVDTIKVFSLFADAGPDGPSACPDCVPLECLPMNGELKRGEKDD